MKTTLTIGMIVLLLMAATCQYIAAAEIAVQWTAVGDDGNDGVATGYSICVGPDSLSVVDADNGINGWLDNTVVTVMPVNVPPLPPGQVMTMTITGLEVQTTYWLSCKAYDDAGNYSSNSNIVSCYIEDTTAPAAVIIIGWN